MISIERAHTSPEQWPNRACGSTGIELFFAAIGSPEEAEAMALCGQCPRLRQCAGWAKRAGMSDCVVASVRMPIAGRSRKAAMAQLDQVATTGQVPGQAQAAVA